MSGLEVLAVVACVAGVISAYHDGTGLIKRIKDKRASRKALEEEKTRPLEGSLELGPLIVQGQYDHDYRRWGQRYSQGDAIARESLKDIIIHLQSALLTNLQHAWQDDVEIDFRTLQVVSDDSRVKAVMTLCQLYQRLSEEAPIVLVPATFTPPQHVARVSTVSTIGSVSPAPTPPRLSYVSTTSTASFPQPTTPVHESLAGLTITPPQQVPPPTQRRSSGSSRSLIGVFTRRSKPAPDASTATLTQNTHVPPHLQPQANDAASMRSDDWLLKETDPSRSHADQVSIISSDQASNEDSMYWGPDDINNINPWVDPPTHEAPKPLNQHHRVPTSNLEVVQQSQLPPVPIQHVESTKLYLPCEENKFAGFCKGAWKLQIGMKKAMTAEYRPSGIYGQIPFWRCQKCCFEGQMMGRDKASRSFDNRIRQSNGIRYRWVFLAKSHTFSKSIARCTDGSAGTFGCIFCCAELSKVPPMFGNVESLMNHLQAHRDRPPTGELLYRTKCLVGKIGGPDDDFDINLPPRVHEVEE